MSSEKQPSFQLCDNVFSNLSKKIKEFILFWRSRRISQPIREHPNLPFIRKIHITKFGDIWFLMDRNVWKIVDLYYCWICIAPQLDLWIKITMDWCYHFPQSSTPFLWLRLLFIFQLTLTPTLTNLFKWSKVLDCNQIFKQSCIDCLNWALKSWKWPVQFITLT